MKKKSQRMASIARVSEIGEREAARMLAECQRRAEEKRRRLRELEAYEAEYAERFRQLTQDGVSAARVQEYRLFVAKLNASLVQQRKLVAAHEYECEEQRQRWLASRTRTKMMETVVDRSREEERRESERREQRVADDRVVPLKGE